jgi:hypothetical protein
VSNPEPPREIYFEIRTNPAEKSITLKINWEFEGIPLFSKEITIPVE